MGSIGERAHYTQRRTVTHNDNRIILPLRRLRSTRDGLTDNIATTLFFCVTNVGLHEIVGLSFFSDGHRRHRRRLGYIVRISSLVHCFCYML